MGLGLGPGSQVHKGSQGFTRVHKGSQVGPEWPSLRHEDRDPWLEAAAAKLDPQNRSRAAGQPLGPKVLQASGVARAFWMLGPQIAAGT